jgi:hypothetical protein
MFATDFFDTSEIESSLGFEKSKPIVAAFQRVKQFFNDNQTILDKQQSILNEHEVAIQKNQNRFEEYQKDALNRKAEIKKDLLIEIATKADIKKLNGKIDAQEQKLNGKIDALEQKLNGKIDALEQKLSGEFKSIHLWMKMLLALSLLSIACFSPTAQALIKLLKF